MNSADPSKGLFYSAPPPPPPEVNITVKNETNKKEPEPPKREGKPTPPPRKRQWISMTLSKLTLDNDMWIENNDKYHYPNHKIASSRLI